MNDQYDAKRKATLIRKLEVSITELEQAVRSVTGSIPEEYNSRLAGYVGIIEKQRDLTKELKEALKADDLDKLPRIVSLINGLSAMVTEDAKIIVQELAKNKK